MTPETSAEWIDQQLTRVFHAHAKEDVDRVIPYLLLAMALDDDEGMPKALEAELMLVLDDAGITDEMPAEEAQQRMTDYLLARNADRQLLAEIVEIYRTHHQAMGSAAGERYLNLTQRSVVKEAARVDEKPPEGSIRGADLARKHTTRLR